MRRRAAEKRQVIPDPKFGDDVVASFINRVMLNGKKSLAEKVVYTALDVLGEKYKRSKPEDAADGEGGSGSGSISLDAFHKAVNNVCPEVEVKSRRVGGATYQVPVEVPLERQKALAMRWIIQYARKRSEKGMALRLAGELLDAALGRGESVKKREDTYRMAKANQAFVHFRWN